jgi:Transposase DDE domain
MRHSVNPLQGRLFDPYQPIIPPLGLQRISKGWQSIFRAILLALMPVRQLGAHFHPTNGRPTKELYSVAGLLFLQESNDWTNAEAVDAYLFRTDMQFALNLEPGFDEMCERTLERYRALFLEDDLAARIMNDVTQKLVDELDLRIDQQRLDSTHVFSDMASFGRTRMMAVCNKRFLTQVQRHYATDFNALPEELRRRYAPSQAKLFTSKGLSAEQRSKSRQQAAEDMRDLINRFADHSGLNARPSYQALLTVFGQQCEIVEDKIVVKVKTGGRCVQNPSDPDATYDGCKGQGYKVQLVETCADENEVQLILSAIPQTAAEHDAMALAPVLADLQSKDLLPEVMLADTAYGSDENVQAAAKLGVELVAPLAGAEPESADSSVSGAASEAVPTAAETSTTEPAASCDRPLSATMEKLTIDDFSVDERTGRVGACPSGRIPLDVLYNQGKNEDKTIIEMRQEDCANCPFRDACPMEETKQGKYKLEYTAKQRRLDERRREEDTDAFRKRYAKRSGLESTNGGLKRKHQLGALHVRGSPAVGHAIYLKVAGWNLSRAAASGKLASRAAEILSKLGLEVARAARCSAFRLIKRVWSPGRPALTASAA